LFGVIDLGVALLIGAAVLATASLALDLFSYLSIPLPHPGWAFWYRWHE
jgi:hypothetical protein